MRSRFTELPIRTRIALWIAGISTALLVFMAIAVYGVFAQQLTTELDQTIALRAASYQQLLDRSTTPPTLHITVPEVDLGTGEGILRLYAVDGALLQDASPSAGQSSEEQALVQAVGKEQTERFQTIDLADDEDYRVIAQPIDGGAQPMVLVSGLELSRINGPLRLLRLILIIAVPVTAAGASLGGYWVASRALQPVAAMAETAQRITEGDLSQRVPGAESGDELGQLASTLNAMIERIDETMEKERRFTADASHELRTPLAAIDATIDVTMSRSRSEADYRAAMSDIRAQTQRLAQLTRQLLLLSRLDAGQVREGFEPLDLAELVNAVCESFREAHDQVTIVTEIVPGAHLVNGNFELLVRALFNIFDNAVMHVGPLVALRVHLGSLPGTEVLIIDDNGAGIPADLTGTVFERFDRGNAARSTPGSGLGLSIVRAIVLAHGGSIALDPPVAGAGARMTIRLPQIAPPGAG